MARRTQRDRAHTSAIPDPKAEAEQRRYHAALTAASPRVVVAAPGLDLSAAALLSALFIALAHTLLVAAAGWFQLALAGAPVFQPAAGLLLGALILGDRRQWPFILAFAFVLNSLAGPALGGGVVGLGPAFALAACGQAYFGARLFARLSHPTHSLDLRDVALLGLVAATVGAAGGLLQAGLLVATGRAESFLGAWQAWSLAGALGILLVTPAVLAWARSPREALAAKGGWLRAAEPALALLAFGLAAGLLFDAPAVAPGIFTFAYLLFPGLIWIALRHGRPGAAAAGLLLGGIAAWFTVRGRGPFALALGAGDQPLLWLQIYLAVAVLSTLSLAVVIARRKRAAVEMQQAHGRLAAWARELEQRNRQVALLSRMGDLFQSCMTAEDALHVVALMGPQLFPEKSGAVYLLDPNGLRARAATAWGPLRLPEDSFTRDECLALRRGRMYGTGTGKAGRPCRHAASAGEAPYLCVPLLALGEVIGVAHLRAVAAQNTAELDTATLELAPAFADGVALALEHVRMRQTLREQSIRDPLTGLFNRRYMEETLARELSRAHRAGSPVGLILFDLDGFKNFNDTYGHPAGDTALRELGGFLRARVRAEDVACRYGGDEFILILPNSPFEATRERAEQLRDELKEIQLTDDGRALGPLNTSMGLAAYPAQGLTGHELVRAADAALYQAKQAGRDQAAVPQVAVAR